ncbi:MAG: 23S rRNA (uracil-5-)-methyltransferase RumA, partial [Bacilli bacterium]|nr:23S rRNA (uracil-5-)-methyltransferase RumA [Bacilli bacterium]
TLINKKIKKVIYISCDPETLARDLKYLSPYYDVNYIQPVDMFPMTAHVETVCGLLLKDSKK